MKRSITIEQPDGSTKAKKEMLWGYGSGVAAATIPDYGDVVLAEYTQPFNASGVTYFRSLYQQASAVLDAASDAWYVYEAAARHGGIAAVPLNQHGHPAYQRDPDGVTRCPTHLRMYPTIQFNHSSGFRAQRFQCPLLFPENLGLTCDHEQFLKDKGCVKDLNWEASAFMRVSLDRTGPLYYAVLTQRTACERIDSQAKALGIERPHVRNARSIANLNTLIYLVLDVRALQRATSINAGLLSPPNGVRYMIYVRPSRSVCPHAPDP